MKIYNAMTRASQWTRCAFARNSVGNDVFTSSSDVVCRCLSGWVLFCYPNDDGTVVDKIQEIIGMSIITYNDQPGRTFREVRALVKKAGV